jgi:ribosome-associated toxin RatA of RatAB toxin-antitoxin module|tara:strand:+ start:564 stop:995 length:432 start_codon:yes stop_codon:yes gene_type:complete
MSSSFEGSEIFEAPPERILFLINNFESYKEFLPGCLESSKLPDSEEGFIFGRLVFSILNKTYEFESKNKTSGYEISISQSKGPFLDFYAQWSLEAIEENQTGVKFETKFTLPFVLEIIATQSLIDKIGKKFINAFAKHLLKLS